MPKAILFDLDGTLIDSSMETFLPAYFGALTKKLAHLVPPEKLIAQLQASTRAAVASDDLTHTIAEKFAADFFPGIGHSTESLMPLFDDFYTREYPRLHSLVNRMPEAREVVARAIELGYKTAIATMPVFPETAIRQRMEWGGLADLAYVLVTDYQTMHASKPRSAYYREIATMIGCAPEDCIMVGNEVENDILPAKRAGMRTFFVTNRQNANVDTSSDWRGTLKDFGGLLESKFR